MAPGASLPRAWSKTNKLSSSHFVVTGSHVASGNQKSKLKGSRGWQNQVTWFGRKSHVACPCNLRASILTFSLPHSHQNPNHLKARNQKETMRTKTRHTKSKTMPTKTKSNGPRMRCQTSETEKKNVTARIPPTIKNQLKNLEKAAKHREYCPCEGNFEECCDNPANYPVQRHGVERKSVKDFGGKKELQKVERRKAILKNQKNARTTVKDFNRMIKSLENLLEKLKQFSETVEKEYLHFRDQHKTPCADKKKCHAEWELFKNDLEFVSTRLWNFSYVRFPLHKAMKRVVHKMNRSINQISSDSFKRKVIRELNDVKGFTKIFRKGGDLPETLNMLKEHKDDMKALSKDYDLKPASIDRHESFLGIFEELCNIVFEVSGDLSDTFNDMTSKQILKISDVVKNIYLELNKPHKWNDGDGPDGESDSRDSDDSGSEFERFYDTDDDDNDERCDDVKQ
eukprot:jgi/Bigna1/129994/aug1.10_g4702